MGYVGARYHLRLLIQFETLFEGEDLIILVREKEEDVSRGLGKGRDVLFWFEVLV
jgi:hypothetical protein